MPHTHIWVHAVWCTKGREPMLKKTVRSQLFAHILANARQMHLAIDTINGVEDHVHALLRLYPDQSIAWVIQLIKGEATHWINQNYITPWRFQWQEKYYAESVSESGLDRVRRYIQRQEIHHLKISTEQEESEMKAKGKSGRRAKSSMMLPSH